MEAKPIKIDRSSIMPGHAHVWLGSSIVAAILPGGEIVGRAGHLPNWLVTEIRAALSK